MFCLVQFLFAVSVCRFSGLFEYAFGLVKFLAQNLGSGVVQRNFEVTGSLKGHDFGSVTDFKFMVYIYWVEFWVCCLNFWTVIYNF